MALNLVKAWVQTNAKWAEAFLRHLGCGIDWLCGSLVSAEAVNHSGVTK